MNRIVLAATLIAALTFAVMIGAFYIAEQYLQRVAGFSALGASGALVLVALLVGAAAPLAGELVDRSRRAAAGAAGVHRRRGRAGDPRHPRRLAGRRGHRAAADPGRARAGDAVRPHLAGGAQRQPAGLARPDLGACCRWGACSGAAVGAGLAGVALSGTLTASTVHHTLLLAAALCLVVGIPASTALGGGSRPATAES